MHEIEKWIEDLYNKRFKLDRESVRKFIRKELRESPLESTMNSINVIQGVVELYSMYHDMYILEKIKYDKELREKEEKRKENLITDKNDIKICLSCETYGEYFDNKNPVCFHNSFRPKAYSITKDFICPKFGKKVYLK